jgi:hypothetical protein
LLDGFEHNTHGARRPADEDSHDVDHKPSCASDGERQCPPNPGTEASQRTKRGPHSSRQRPHENENATHHSPNRQNDPQQYRPCHAPYRAHAANDAFGACAQQDSDAAYGGCKASTTQTQTPQELTSTDPDRQQDPAHERDHSRLGGAENAQNHSG